MSIMEHLVKVEQATNSAEEFAKVSEISRNDGHVIIQPTDVVIKNGEIVGYFSVMPAPIISAFFASKKVLPRDSATAINIIEQVVKRSTGVRTLFVPVNKSSPFYNAMFDLGYKRDEEISYFYKYV